MDSGDRRAVRRIREGFGERLVRWFWWAGRCARLFGRSNSIGCSFGWGRLVARDGRGTVFHFGASGSVSVEPLLEVYDGGGEVVAEFDEQVDVVEVSAVAEAVGEVGSRIDGGERFPGNGVALAYTLIGANRHDVTELLALLHSVPPIAGRIGQPRTRPMIVLSDRAYGSSGHRDVSRRRGIDPRLAARNTEHGSGLGVYRWVVERTFGFLHQFRRLRIRYERRAEVHESFRAIGCIMICFRAIRFARECSWGL